MEARAAEIAAGNARELIWLLEHPPLYTAGTSARDADLLDAARFPVYRTGRGGQFTYHGPGQRVIYTMLNLRRHRRDVRAFIESLETWVIDTLERFSVTGEIRPGRVGVWVPGLGPEGRGEEKIAAIGIRVRRWVAFHGLSLNVDPDLTHFAGIVPCGIADHGVTSLRALGRQVSMEDVDATLRETYTALYPDTVFASELAPDETADEPNAAVT
jgi:lipoyl(octanoyl) transferase